MHEDADLKFILKADKYFQKFGDLILMRDDGLCPQCHQPKLLMDIDEEGIHGILCKKCGWEKDERNRWKSLRSAVPKV